MSHEVATAIKSGTTKVTTAQTAVPLISPEVSPNLNRACLGVYVGPDPNNIGNVAIGDSTVNAKAVLGTFKGMLLTAKLGPIFIPIEDVTQLWIDAEKSGDYVIWTVLYQ